MQLRTLLSIVLITASATACGEMIAPDVNAPDLPPGPSARTSGAARNTLKATTTSVTAGLESVQINKLRFKRSIRLMTLDTSFTVVQGVAAVHQIDFARTLLDLANPFLSFRSPASARFVDGSGHPLPDGSVVPLEVSVDDKALIFRFGPHGSTFARNDPAILRVNLGAVDLQGRSPSELRLYYRSAEPEEWTLLDTPVRIDGEHAEVSLYHFSNYALAF